MEKQCPGGGKLRVAPDEGTQGWWWKICMICMICMLYLRVKDDGERSIPLQVPRLSTCITAMNWPWVSCISHLYDRDELARGVERRTAKDCLGAKASLLVDSLIETSIIVRVGDVDRYAVLASVAH